jgi:hypothetical protein
MGPTLPGLQRRQGRGHRGDRTAVEPRVVDGHQVLSRRPQFLVTENAGRPVRNTPIGVPFASVTSYVAPRWITC